MWNTLASAVQNSLKRLNSTTLDQCSQNNNNKKTIYNFLSKRL